MRAWRRTVPGPLNQAPVQPGSAQRAARCPLPPGASSALAQSHGCQFTITPNKRLARCLVAVVTCTCDARPQYLIRTA
jgi:hypothetical protein